MRRRVNQAPEPLVLVSVDDDMVQGHGGVECQHDAVVQSEDEFGAFRPST